MTDQPSGVAQEQVHVLCRVDELGVGEARRFEVNGQVICLARCASGIYAIDDTCSHENYSLSLGEVDSDVCEIECSKHGSMFSLVTGVPTTLPATTPVRTYRLVIDGEQIAVAF